MLSELRPPVYKTDAPELFFVSIIPNFAGNEEYLAELITKRYTHAGITRFAMSYPMHPQGMDVYDKIRQQAASFRRLKSLLKDAPFKLGVLIQSSIGHGGYWNLAPECGISGTKSLAGDGTESIRFCPYEPNFLDYIYNAVKMIALEGPDFFMGDDDMRMGENCYCHNHLDVLEKKTGRRFTREELVEYLKDVKPFDPIACAFEEANIEGMDALCKAIRRACDEVNPEINGAVCICGPRFDYVPSQLKYIGGPHPFLRISNANYLESNAKDQARVDRGTSWQTVNFRKLGVPLLDESDTCPHNRFSKSARTMNLHIVSGILHGTDGGKLWLDQSVYPLPEESNFYENTIAANQGLYRELHRLMRGFTAEGTATRIPAFESEPYPHIGMGFHYKSDWGVYAFGRMGIPMHYTDMDGKGITLIAGEQVIYYTDEQIRKMLSGACLLDGVAASILTARGYSDLIGVRAECDNMKTIKTGSVQEQMLSAGKRKNSFKANSEASLLEPPVRMSFSARDNTAKLEMLPGAEPLSRVTMTAYKGAEAEYIMPGAVYFENSLGGKVVTMCMDVMAWPYMMVLNPCRKKFYLSILEKLGGVPAWINTAQDCKLICGKLADGRTMLAAINYGYDPMPLELTVKMKVSKIMEVQGDGGYQALEFVQDGDQLKVNRTLEAAQISIMVIE